MNRWLWICPILVVLLSVTVFFYWGWSWTTIGLIAFVMVCPAVLIWGASQVRKAHGKNLKVGKIRPGGKRS